MREANVIAILLTALPLIISPVFAQTAKPSFDCTKASTLAEKAICADPSLALTDANIASNYAAALKRLDPAAASALREDQQYFVQTRDRIADFNHGVPKEKQNFDLGDTMRDRVAFLASIRSAPKGFIGTWKSLEGQVVIKARGKGRFEVEGTIAKPTNGDGCDIGGIARNEVELKLVDTDDDDKPTGFIFTLRRSGDLLIAVQSGLGKDGSSQPPSCGAESHFDGTFFFTSR